jgi:hypothetical protein
VKNLTVPQGVATKTVKPDHFEFWINNEATPLIRAVRDAANVESMFDLSYTTDASSASYTIWTSEQMPNNGCWRVRARVVAVSTAGAATGGSITYEATFIAASGVVSNVGTDYDNTAVTGPGIEAVLVANGNFIDLNVADGGSALRFRAKIEVLEVIP